jgi:hypothetical protein
MKNTAALLVLTGFLAACGNSQPLLPKTADSSGGNNSGIGAVTAPKSRYDLANQCFALQSLGNQQFAAKSGSGYTVTATSAATGAHFYMKPTALGQYLFYDTDKTMLSASSSGLTTVTAADATAIWTLDTPAPGQYTALSNNANASLAVGSGNALTVATSPGTFAFVPAIGCTVYPEMPTGVAGASYVGNGVDKPVIGFADVHTHMAMAQELSDGSGNVGGSAAELLYGQMFNRFGVVEALKNCEAYHGPQGRTSPGNVFLDSNPLESHDTVGWPTFVDWPARNSLLHQQMYYKWVERAWKAGLRLMVVHGTNIQALCTVGAAAGMRPSSDCNDMSIGLKQLAYLKQMPDYIDAQEGGPGKGWFRIVSSPTEARQVINEGKLAVVPGLEFANLFDCSVSFLPGGGEMDGCTKADIDAGIENVYKLGVRQIFTFHDVDSALGGTGLFSPIALNLVGFVGTQHFWTTYDCPDKGEGPTWFYEGGGYLEAIPMTGSDPVTSLVLSAVQGTVPIYPADKRQCNSRGVTDLGKYALQQLMKKKFVLDIDHTDPAEKDTMLAMAKAQTPAYPLLSAHSYSYDATAFPNGGLGGMTLQQAKDMLDMGGLIYPAKGNGKNQANMILNKLKPIWPAGRPLAAGYGADANGFYDMALPRGAGSTPVHYPFTLFSGPGWGPQFAAAGIKPLSFDLLTIPESGKQWNVDEVGMAHYGLVADFVEETRIEGGEEAISALYNSAEAYLEMWEKTVNR